VTDDDRSGRGSFTLVELSEVSGVSARTIRGWRTAKLGALLNFDTSAAQSFALRQPTIEELLRTPLHQGDAYLRSKVTLRPEAGHGSAPGRS